MEETKKPESKIVDGTAPAIVGVQPSKPEINNVMKEFPKDNSKRSTVLIVIGAFLVVLVGIGTGWMLSGSASFESSLAPDSTVAPGAGGSENEAGIMDESGFEEEAPVGMLVEGGLKGEGTHYLDRGLGEEKNVYLTSTVLDLQSFVGKEVRVWGNTVAAQNAPWLMDVGKLKVVE